ncbi:MULTISPECIES: molybdate ABC transporter substrate-binding protein [unclassified Clostridium]|uniref:molybdate ABC transporter substrate-binding protein n=1 Tax=unclassified Clostridium TaxID=2614128 RepID=UPI000297D8AA|nr:MULTISPECIES: molybdate ABC transporter substrate-binding protein [unclassified Clostridium]EKQ52344.1 MAG: molybdenum ABC transporter, periplasmic molybdate-binding protein [Clostridium sp. Maddingley MBC34-26]
MKKKIILSSLLALLLSLLIIGCGAQKDPASTPKDSSTKSAEPSVELNISAAASLKEAMGDIQNEYKKVKPNVTLTVNFGASGSLQQQIEQGAPCDIFISAGQSQMKALDDKSLILENTKKDLVKNDLVLVGPKDTTLTGLSDLNTDKVRKIAVGEPSSVPAGKYADEVFTKLGIKDAVSSKLVFAKDVKEVLAWSTSGNAEVGFVYKSDALSSDSAKIIETVPDDKHSPITYPIGIIKASKNPDDAKAFEEFLFSDTCKKIFEKYGYGIA